MNTYIINNALASLNHTYIYKYIFTQRLVIGAFLCYYIYIYISRNTNRYIFICQPSPLISYT